MDRKVYFLIFIVHLYLFSADVTKTNAEVFSSTENLRRLSLSETHLLALLQKAENEYPEKAETIKSMYDIFLDHNSRTQAAEFIGSPLHPAEHPIDALVIIKYWAMLGQNLLDHVPDLKVEVDRILKTNMVSLPQYTDYSGAVAAVLRLQWVYRLPTDDLIQGVVQGYQSVSLLDSGDMYNLGFVAFDSNRQATLEWLEASDRMSASRPACFSNISLSERKRTMYTKLAELYDEMEYFPKAINLVELAMEQGETADLKAMYERVKERMRLSQPSQGPKALWNMTQWKIADQAEYEALCRGDNPGNNIELDPSLDCQYKVGILPYIRYKEEIHHWDPRVSLFVDVISDKEILQIQELAYPQLFRSQVGGENDTFVGGIRVSKQAWLFDYIHPLIKKLSQRVEDITRLSTKYLAISSHSEAFQILNYGMGGQYEPHHDYFEDEATINVFLKNTGNRLVTWMFYLSDVVAGGATVYPRIGVRVPPRKNAAAFWYNMRLSGEKDPDTKHAGCPVLLGQKWAANKWIRSKAQWRHRPCALDYSASDPR